MVSTKLLISIAVMVLVAGSTQALKKEVDEASCKGHDVDVNKDQMMVILDCAAELGVMSRDDLTPDKLACFGRCLIEKKGFIDHDGTLHKEKIIEEVDSSVPDALKADVKKHLTECLDMHAKDLKPAEEKCESYKPLTDCLHKAYLALCVEGNSK